jgi:uncharacterized protein YjiS (DUF1127 family)
VPAAAPARRLNLKGTNMNARVHASALLGATAQALAPLEVCVRFLWAALAQRLARARQARHHAAARRALAQLDAATLRDIGIETSEIDSLLAEVEGRAPATRMRALMSLHRPGSGD